MKLITVDAIITCKHISGKVKLDDSNNIQDFVTIRGRPVLVENDPELKQIMGCANMGPTIKPCTNTLKVTQGYSDLIRIQGRRACLMAVKGLTDGTPPGTVQYEVRSPGQDFVEERS
jgi:hypothetical protein